MFRPNSILLAGLVLGLLVLLGGLSVLKGGLYVGKHEGDTVHLVQIVLRMAQGDIPHRDIMTPLGILAVGPIALLSSLGMGVGKAFLWAQVAVAAILAPAIWWVAATRLGQWGAALFCLFCMVLLLALVHGEAEPAVSVSMHYNRWAWALSFIAIVAAVIPPADKGTGTVDGLIVGLCMAALALIKVTYFVAFALPVALALVLTEQRRALVVALAAGLAVAGLVTVLLGPSWWAAYAADMQAVAGSDVRPQPGLPLAGVIAAPLYLGASLAGLAAVIFLRQAGADTPGLILLLLLPGFFYVTFQNFGNDPQWLLVLAVLLLSVKPHAEARNGFGLPHRTALGALAAVVLAMAAPSFFNLAYSPIRHYAVDTEDYVPLLPRGGKDTDLQVAAVRALRTDIRVPVDAPDLGLPAFRAAEERETPVTFMGETRAYCSLDGGLVAVLDAIARDLEEAGFSGLGIFTADLFNATAIYGDFAFLRGGTPWYYGGLPGYDAADLLLVPTCPVSPDVQSKVLTALTERGTDDLTEVRRTALYTLYRIGPAVQPGAEPAERPGSPSSDALPDAAAVPDALPDAVAVADDAGPDPAVEGVGTMIGEALEEEDEAARP